MRGPRPAGAMIVLALTMGSMTAIPAAADTHDFAVQAGAVHPTNPSAPYEYTRFYPDTLRVHRGQTVRWTIAGTTAVGSGFHTITFTDTRPHAYRNDDIPGTYAATQEWAFGSDCGRNGLAPCVLTENSTFISSGTPPTGASPFDVTFDAPPGVYEYLCTVHPSMTGTVEVVGDAEVLPTQAEIDAQVADEIALDSANADAVFLAGQVPSSTVDPETGQTVWSVLLGDSTEDNHVAILAYLPSALEIAAGDRVEYSYRAGIMDEIHTATFPAQFVEFTSMTGFYPACDLDDLETGAKGIPGLWGGWPLPCPGTVEIALAPWMTSPTPAPGNMVATPLTLHDSALLVPEGAGEEHHLPSGPLPDSFTADFPLAGSFSYACTVHGRGMSGGVTVA